MSGPGEITVLLAAVQRGDPNAETDLVSLVYRELRDIARRQMARERAEHTLQPTALVHETYLKLLRSGATLNDRQHFFAAASMVMRHILVDHAKRKKAVKHGGKLHRVELNGNEPTALPSHEQVLIVDQALTRLADWNPKQARAVELMYFGGLSEDEAALVLEVSTRQVRRYWKAAKAWLNAELKQRTA